MKQDFSQKPQENSQIFFEAFQVTVSRLDKKNKDHNC